MGVAFALAFFKKGGFPLPKLIQNFFVFLTKPKIYLWRKKTIPPKITKKIQTPTEEEKEEESILKIAKKSRLRNLYTLLETRGK
jgi:hypothetical protein